MFGVPGLLPVLEVAPLCKVSGNMALMASGRICLWAFRDETLGRDPGHNDLLGRHGFSWPWQHVPGVFVAQSLTLLPGPSHLLLVAWLEPLIGKQALICQRHVAGRTLSSGSEDRYESSKGEGAMCPSYLEIGFGARCLSWNY